MNNSPCFYKHRYGGAIYEVEGNVSKADGKVGVWCYNILQYDVYITIIT